MPVHYCEDPQVLNPLLLQRL